MDLASVVAALASVGVRVSGSTPNSSVQVDSSRACPTRLAGSEPSGTINDPGQHFQCPTHKADTEAYKKAHGSKKRAPAGIREAKVEVDKDELSKLMSVGTELAKEIQEIKRN